MTPKYPNAGVPRKDKLGCLVAFVGLFIRVPLGYALTFMILKTIDASDVMWLLFWIGVPLSLLMGIIEIIAKHYIESDTN